MSEISASYRLVWRWHFYAGLFVLPFLMLMALTGGLYLFQAEIDGLVYQRLSQVEPRGSAISAERWVAAAEAGVGGRVTDFRVPAAADEAVRMTVERPDGSRRTAFVDPYDGRLIGSTAFGGVMELVKRLHSLDLIGPWANYLVEVVAGWALVLVATGLFLWWPRGRNVGVVFLRTLALRERGFWRDLHAVVGLYAAAVIALLVVTGMPWSAFWGGQFLGYVKDRGLGRPAPPSASRDFEHARHGDAPAGAGWTMEGMVMPLSTSRPRDLGAVMRSVETAALSRPFIVSLPGDPSTAITAAREIRRVEDTRLLYIDGATGRIEGDVGYAQFGPGARAFEWGIAVHQGTQYGWINRYLMLAGCVAIWLLAISGLVMWWKRRPPSLSTGRLGAPPAPSGLGARRAVLGIVLPITVVYPLTGASLLIALVADGALRAFRRSRGR